MNPEMFFQTTVLFSSSAVGATVCGPRVGAMDREGWLVGMPEGFLVGSGGEVGEFRTGARVGRTRRQLENQLLSRMQTSPSGKRGRGEGG